MAWRSGVCVYTEHGTSCRSGALRHSVPAPLAASEACLNTAETLFLTSLKAEHSSRGGGAGQTQPRWPIRLRSGSSSLSVGVYSLTMETAGFLAWVLVLSVSSVPSGKTLDTSLKLHTMGYSFTSDYYPTGAAASQLVYLWACDRIHWLHELILISNSF